MTKKNQPVTSAPVMNVEVPRERTIIKGRIIDTQAGMIFLPEVFAVRIRCETYNLLVMEDYLPIMGRVDGDVTFLTPEGEENFHHILGFFKHQHNEFTLIIEANKPPQGGAQG